MFRLNLKIALRNLWKYKGYTFINVLGLSIGMAGCILIFIFIRYQLSFDQQFVNKDRIYRVVSYFKYKDGSDEYQKGVPRPLVPAMRNDFGMLEEIAALQSASGVLKVQQPDGKMLKIFSRTFYVEPQFFKIFDYPWLQGDPQQALKEPNTVALSQKMATRLFGDWHKAVGQTINYENKTNLKVTGIFADIPPNNSNPIKIAISYAGYESRNMKNWNSVASSSECYIMLKPGVTIESLEAPNAAFIKKYRPRSDSQENFFFYQPLSELHKDSRYTNFSGKIVSKNEMTGLVVIGLFLLITACINFINLATAQAVNRSKEVGVRKVMGSQRKQLILQFLTETMTLTVIAVLVACAITEAALPGMANLFNEEISFSLVRYPVILLFMIGLVITIGFLAGFYPAMVMSGFSPALAIKNKIKVGNSGGVNLRRILVSVQFIITVVLIIATLVLLRQMKFMEEKPLGFDANAIALIEMPSDSTNLLKYETFKTRILKEKGVYAASFCSAAPASEDNNWNDFAYERTEAMDFQANIKVADQDYFQTFNLKLLAGTGLSKSDTIKEFVINETMAHKLGIVKPEDAIGKMISFTEAKKWKITGVVKDFNNLSLRESISPILLFSKKDRGSLLAIKMDARQTKSVMKNAENLFNIIFPDQVYDSSFMDEEIRGYYETEQVMSILFKVFATVIIFIAFIGLFGLISFVAAQRTKEMAIRKILGASTLELVKMLNASFVLIVFFANLLAWPIAYLLVSKWLERYAYRVDLSIWPFMIAMLISMLITLVTVSMRSYKAANTNPVDALKYE